MKTAVTITVFSFLLFSGVKTSAAQNRNPEDVTGKIEGRLPGSQDWHFGMRNNLDRNNSKYYQAMKANLLKILPVIINAPAVKPPKGFDVAPSLVAYPPSNNNNRVLSGSIEMLCYNYAKNLYGNEGLHKQDESHGNLFFSINDLKRIAAEDFKYACRDAGVPLFFIKPDIKRINDNVLAIGNDTKIIKKQDRPVIVPLTKKEYLESLVKRMSLSLESGQENLNKIIEKDLPEMIQQLQKAKKEYSDLLQNKVSGSGVRGRAKIKMDSLFIHILPEQIVTTQQYINKERTALAKLASRIAQYKAEMNEEPGKPAFVNYNDVRKFPGGADNRFFRPLASPSDRDAKPLFKFNPDYYDTSLPKTAIQVILLQYNYSHFSPVFERKALENWFEEINTESLSRLVR